jgi:hypothetical protein
MATMKPDVKEAGGRHGRYPDLDVSAAGAYWLVRR